MMRTSKLEKPAWQAYFDRVSKSLGSKLAEIEVSSLSIGAQIEAEWLPFHGIVYDPHSDLVEVVLEGLDHLIRKPSEIFIEEGPTGLQSLQVSTEDGIREIIKLRDPLMLPAPGG